MFLILYVYGVNLSLLTSFFFLCILDRCRRFAEDNSATSRLRSCTYESSVQELLQIKCRTYTKKVLSPIFHCEIGNLYSSDLPAKVMRDRFFWPFELASELPSSQSQPLRDHKLSWCSRQQVTSHQMLRDRGEFHRRSYRMIIYIKTLARNLSRSVWTRLQARLIRGFYSEINKVGVLSLSSVVAQHGEPHAETVVKDQLFVAR